MGYFIIGFVFLLFIASFFIPEEKEVGADYKLSPYLTDRQLIVETAELAKRCVNTVKGGKGLRINLSEKLFDEAFNVISIKSGKVRDFEYRIYDNFYKFKETVIFLKQSVGDIKKLPHIGGVPRVYLLTKLLVGASGGYVTESRTKDVFDCFNSYCPLTFSEIKLSKTLLFFSLAEYLTVFCAKCVNINRNEERGRKDSAESRLNLNLLNSAAYLTALYSAADGRFKEELSKTLTQNGVDLREKSDAFLTSLNHYNMCVQSAVATLCECSKWYNDIFMLSVSPADKIYSVEKSYSTVTVSTKFLYLDKTARLADKRGIGETAAARQISELISGSEEDIAFQLLKGIPKKWAMRIYVFAEIFAAALISAIIFFIFPVFGIAASVVSFPINFISVRLITEYFTGKSGKRYLPAVDLEYIKDSGANITVSRLIADLAEAEDAVNKLKITAFANNGKNLSYTLLADLLPGKNQNDAGDGKIIEYLKNEFDKLKNERFNLLIRKRSYEKSKSVYQGWEKKRGALLDLNGLILRGDSSPFLCVCGNTYKQKYVIALDSDTVFNSAEELLCLMEHPYNMQYSVMSLNISVSPDSASKSYFSRFFSGAKGINAYCGHCLSSEFDIFAEGNYTGKGIYRVSAFDSAVSEIFPDNRIISHDFIEGAFAGCADSDICAMDDFPSTFPQFLKRQLRWIRGDWQLFPYLFKTVKNKNEEKVRNTLSPMSKFHIFANIISPLAPLSSLILLTLGIFTPIYFGYFIVFGLLHNFISVLFSLKTVFIRPKLTLGEVLRQMFFIAVLPVLAWHYTLSAVITVLRLIKGKNLLEWKVFAHSGGKHIFLWQNYIFAALLAIVGGFFYGIVFYYVLAFIFAAAEIFEVVLSQTRLKKRYMSGNLSAYLASIAGKTWQYFTDTLISKYNFLPCDNYQEYLNKGFAPRTSPTNIGLALVSAVSAMLMGLISKQKFESIAENIIKTVEKLPKWKGNLYNWYDTESLNVLNPKYVSSVDSGNFLASLIMTSNFVSGELRERTEKIINNCRIEELYDIRRGLLRIGYNDTEKRFDNNYYDLAGSECVIAYLAAIGAGKLPKSAWFNLDKKFVRYSGKTLFSWTGGMFEIVFPSVFYSYPEGTLMNTAVKGTVKAQLEYGRNNLFWGVSESQYAQNEENGDYKYKAFGVPETALYDRADGSTVSPYATVLALAYAAQEAECNIARFTLFGAIGKYGLYEAVTDKTIVKSYMSHHQGMILASICNYITGDKLKKTFCSDPRIGAAQILLCENADNIKAVKKLKIPAAKISKKETETRIAVRSVLPAVNILSNGKYHVLIKEDGKGFSIFCGKRVLREDAGFTVSGEEDGKIFDLYGTAVYGNGFASFSKDFGRFCTDVDARVIASNTGEIRKVTLRNKSGEFLKIKLRAYAEPVLTDAASDISHREYSNMFIRTEIDEQTNAVYAYREGGLNAAFIAFGANATYNSSRAKYYQRRKNRKEGWVLDPCFDAEMHLLIPPYGEQIAYFAVIASFNKDELKQRVRLAGGEGYIERAAKAPGQEFCPQFKTCDLAVQLLYGSGYYSSRPPAEIDAFCPTVSIEVDGELSLVRLKETVSELYKLSKLGIKFNFAVIYSEKYAYFAPLVTEINRILEQSGLKNGINGGKVFTVNSVTNPMLAKEIKDFSVKEDRINKEIKQEIKLISKPYDKGETYKFDFWLKTGFGGFLKDYSYAFDVTEKSPPKPWSNIIANEVFGTLITENGGGFTYCENSRQNKLTSFSNDAVLDSPSEFVILGERGLLWSVARAPLKLGGYAVKHGLGFSEFYNTFNGFKTQMSVFIGRAKTKYYHLKINNNMDFPRDITLTFFAKVVLGDFIENTRCSLSLSKAGNKLVAMNVQNGMSLYLDCDCDLTDYTFCLREATDINGNIIKVKGFTQENVGTDFVYTVSIKIEAGAEKEVTFTLGCDSETDCGAAIKIKKEMSGHFESLSMLDISTGDKAVDCILKWLPYQVLCSRFYAKAGFYQVGGAFGFRDQLQDCLALLYVDTKLVRRHITECAKHQFEAGDVQHWWHPPATGIRTHFCDDRLFLPFVTAAYVEFTGDSSVLSERVPYLTDIPISENQKSVYSSPKATDRADSILTHCIKAIDSVRLSEGLVFMGGGDWNDAMDKVGEKGKGVSVWATMFLKIVVDSFMPYITNKEKRAAYVKLSGTLRAATESQWDGEWYKRAITDEGTVLGSAESEECKIDLISQAFAVFCGADSERCESAISSADRLLADENLKILKLLTPPVNKLDEVGYISAYPPGIRENGGQYTHAAVWYVISLFRFGRVKRANQLLDWLNPINRCLTFDGIDVYKNEPYVISADIYSMQEEGSGGWSWYTGSAAWLYKCYIEEFLGIKIFGKTVVFNPRIPPQIKSVKVKIKTDECSFEVLIDNSQDGQRWVTEANGIRYNTNSFKMSGDISGGKVVLKKSNF